MLNASRHTAAYQRENAPNVNGGKGVNARVLNVIPGWRRDA